MAQLRLDLHDAVGEMPAVCMRCGRPATVTSMGRLSWYPAWVYLFLLAGLLGFWVVAHQSGITADVQAPFCNRHRWHWFSRLVVVVGSLLLFMFSVFGALMYVLDMRPGGQDQALISLGIGTVALIVVWLFIFVIAKSTGIQAREITSRDILLSGVSAEFVAAMEDTEEERHIRNRRRRSRAADDEPRPRKQRPSAKADEDRPRPRRKRPPSDAFEE